MSDTDPAPELEARAAKAARRVERHLHHHWKAYAIQGGLMIVVGVLAILAPFAATLASVFLFGWLLIVGGIAGIAFLFRASEAPGFWPTLLLSALAIVLGGVFIAYPLAGSVTLVWLLSLYFLLSGVFNIQIARAMRTASGRFWFLAVSGAIDIVLAILLVIGLPGTAVWAVGLFLGISLITSGAALLSTALHARNDPPSGGGGSGSVAPV